MLVTCAIPLAAAVGVYFDLHRLSGLHVFELSFLEIGGNPNVAQGNNRHKVLPGRDVLTYLYGPFADNSVHGGDDGGVVEIELRLVERRLIAQYLSVGRFRLGLGGLYLFGSDLSIVHFRLSLCDPGLRLIYLRPGSQESSFASLYSSVGGGSGRRCLIELLLRNFLLVEQHPVTRYISVQLLRGGLGFLNLGLCGGYLLLCGRDAGECVGHVGRC